MCWGREVASVVMLGGGWSWWGLYGGLVIVIFPDGGVAWRGRISARSEMRSGLGLALEPHKQPINEQ